MLQEFAQGPLTTKQVADRLGEKPTRLYNHARALERAGLVRLVRTAQNRGTTERYLEAVGSRFEIDESLFAMGRSGSAARAATRATAGALLRSAAAELDRARTDKDAAEPLVAQASIHVTPAEYRRLRARILQWVGTLEQRRNVPRARGANATLTLALVPPGSGAVASRDSRSRAGNP